MDRFKVVVNYVQRHTKNKVGTNNVSCGNGV